MSKDATVNQTDNFWTIQAMVEDVNLDLNEVGVDQFLEIEILGIVPKKRTKIGAVLANNDWSKKQKFISGR